MSQPNIEVQAVITQEVRNVLTALEQWHAEQIGAIDQILERPEAKIALGEGVELEPGTDLHKGFRIGLTIAKHWLGKLPMTIGPIEVEVESEEEE